MTHSTSFLHVEGTKIIDDKGNEVVLRGAGLGGWMTMENFITGYPGCEFQIREALAEVLGKEKSEFFFDRFLEHFFTEADAEFFHSLGLNCIRIAINYRHFEDDMSPLVLKEGAFRHLDRVVDACAKHGIYTIIDLHTAPGGQNQGWHSDHGTHIARFWEHKNLQDRGLWLWGVIAKHYASNPWVAGYNPLNEPADPHGAKRLVAWYDRVFEVIRAVDPHHILFLDGNTYSVDFTAFPEDAATRWPNAAYAIHDYSIYGFPKTPEPYARTPAQLDRQKKTYLRKRAWMDERGLCVWNGEWGPVYARKEFEGEEWEEVNTRRYNVLKDQLEMYAKDRLSWSIWLYKDIGFQGMVYVSRETPYLRLFSKFLRRKWRLAVDAWGTDDRFVKHVYAPIIQHIKDEVPPENRNLYPPIWGLEDRVARLARTMLVAEFLIKEWAEHFRGMNEEQLEELAKSFRFESCEKREGLNQVLQEHAASSGIL